MRPMNRRPAPTNTGGAMQTSGAGSMGPGGLTTGPIAGPSPGILPGDFPSKPMPMPPPPTNPGGQVMPGQANKNALRAQMGGTPGMPNQNANPMARQQYMARMLRNMGGSGPSPTPSPITPSPFPTPISPSPTRPMPTPAPDPMPVMPQPTPLPEYPVQPSPWQDPIMRPY